MIFDTGDYNTLDGILRQMEGCCQVIRRNLQSDNPAKGEIKHCCDKIEENNNLLKFSLISKIGIL